MNLLSTKKKQKPGNIGTKLVRQTLENFSFHAIPNILRTEFLFLKLIWLIFFVIAACYSAYLIREAMVSYLAFEVVNTIEVKKLEEIEFPTVTICNTNSWNFESKTFIGLEQYTGLFLTI